MGCFWAKHVHLGPDDIQYLMERTRYDESEIREFFRGFAQDCPNGKLTPAKFVDFYRTIFHTGDPEKFCEHAFRAFDRRWAGFLNFRDFVIMWNTITAPDPKDKLQWLFRIFDINSDGSITKRELELTLSAIAEMHVGHHPLRKFNE
ncbi:unnamed protein product [Cyprideis torosa]|uniref:Uncharacterized protein n=1 Tax=Cyprideis torosa TaxID=163714 RepID=A0A7R8ZJJ1_9CRUS|nr:unnamed protein product [Cyprideis torosa]CAG0882369.1 unnamed protein product [Cyprideis torosa]